jgi:hypothetical protein
VTFYLTSEYYSDIYIIFLYVQCVDTIHLKHFQALIVSFLKRIKAHIKLRKALSSLDGALPDATYDEICAYDDECAICRVNNYLDL